MIKFIFLFLSISYLCRAHRFIGQDAQKATDTKHHLWAFGQLSYTHNQAFN